MKYLIDLEASPPAPAHLGEMQALMQQLKDGIPKGQLCIFTERSSNGPRRSMVQNDIFLGLQRGPLEAPNATIIRILKERPADKTGGDLVYYNPILGNIQ